MCCPLVWIEKPQEWGRLLYQTSSFFFFIFVDDAAEAWGGVAICLKPDINLREKSFLSTAVYLGHTCLIFGTQGQASPPSCLLTATLLGPSVEMRRGIGVWNQLYLLA